MRMFEKACRFAGTALAVVGGVAIVCMMALIVADVAMKFMFNDPIDGTTAVVAAYFMVALVFLPLAYVSLQRGHLFVELFTQKLSPRRLRPLHVLNGVLVVAYLGFILVFTFEEAVNRMIVGEVWETAADLMAVWPSRWLLPIGLAAMLAVVVLDIARMIRNRDFDPDRPDRPDDPGGNEPV